MKVTKLKSSKIVSINIKDYLIKWDTDGASKIEVKFRDLIFPYWRNSIILYQYRIPGSLLRLDFLNCNKKICVEIDGKQHNEFNKHFHNNSRANFLSSIRRDLDKEEWCEDNGIKVIHLEETDLKLFSPEYILEKFGVSLI